MSTELLIPIDNCHTAEELFDKYTYIVKYCYKKLHKDDFILQAEEDLLQEGYYGLWQACLRFDSSLGIKFFSYAYAAVQNGMIVYIRKNKEHYYNYFSLDNPIQNQEGEDKLTLEGALYEYDNLDNINDTIRSILRAYKKWLTDTRVNSNQTYIARSVYRAQIILTELVSKQKVSVRYIEEQYDINRTTVSKIFKELRQCLQEEYPTRFKNGGKRNGTNN